MKFTIPHKTLIEAAQKASVAAMTPEAQDEQITLRIPTQSCIKITATEGQITMESAVARIQARHVLPVSADVVVHDVGVACIQAKWLLDNLATTNKTNSFVVIETTQDEKYKDGDNSERIVSNGRCRIYLKEGKKEVFSWEGETYSPGKFTVTPQYKGTAFATILAKTMSDAVKSVDFATNATDGEDVCNRIAIRPVGDLLQFMATDGRRCASVNVQTKASIDRTLLVDPKLLGLAMECMAADVECVLDEDSAHVIFSEPGTDIRLTLASDKKTESFPKVPKILSIETPFEFTVDRERLLAALANLSKTNGEKFLMSYSAGDDEIGLETMDEGKGRKASAKVGCVPVETTIQSKVIAMHLGYVEEIVKRLEGDLIKLRFSADEKRIRIEAAVDPNLTSVMARMKTE